MKTLHIDCQLTYDIAEPTLFLLNVPAASSDSQTVRAEAVTTIPSTRIDHLHVLGNNRLLRINASAGRMTVNYLANVDVHRSMPDPGVGEVPVAELPADVLPYLVPTRHCEADLLFPLACRTFGNCARGMSRVQAICQWIRENVDYSIGASHPGSTARDTLAARAGVCRDFAHLAIALCRALNIPARYVTGYASYAEPPPDFHAIFEAYLGGAWYLFDPTELAPVEDLVRIGTGRDASEVPFATFFGSAKLRYLSPLVQAAEPWHPSAALMPLQQPGAGILLAA
jgi:transglutaminase-like putative cysteine protease